MTKGELDAEIGHFVSRHPEGWNHDQWSGFLHHLAEVGHDVSDSDAIGMALEKERLTLTLRGMEIKGLGPKRIEGLASHFGTLWNLMSASREEVAGLPNISETLAEQILDVLQ